MIGVGLTLGHLSAYLLQPRRETFLSLFAVTRERLLIDMRIRVKRKCILTGLPVVQERDFVDRKLDKDGVVSWVDVANCHPTVSGLTKDELLKRFHIKNKEGVILRGQGFFDL